MAHNRHTITERVNALMILGNMSDKNILAEANRISESERALLKLPKFKDVHQASVYMTEYYVGLNHGEELVEMATGGRILSALKRDRKYTSDEVHEKAYTPKRKSKILRYMKGGGTIKVNWPFIMKYHPDYSNNSDVKKVGVLSRYLDNEMSPARIKTFEKETGIKTKPQAEKELFKLERSIMDKSVKNYEITTGQKMGVGGFIFGALLGSYIGYKTGRSMTQKEDVFVTEREIYGASKKKVKEIQETQKKRREKRNLPEGAQPERVSSAQKYRSGGTFSAESKFISVMREWGKGELMDGATKKPVKDQKKALAIAYSEARKIEPSFGKDHKVAGGTVGNSLHYTVKNNKGATTTVLFKNIGNGKHFVRLTDRAMSKKYKRAIILEQVTEVISTKQADALKAKLLKMRAKVVKF